MWQQLEPTMDKLLTWCHGQIVSSTYGGKLVCMIMIHPSSNQEKKMISVSLNEIFGNNCFSSLYLEGFVRGLSFVNTLEWGRPRPAVRAPSSLGAGLSQKVTRAGSWMGDQHTGPSRWKVSPVVVVPDPCQPSLSIVDLCNPRTRKIAVENVGQSHTLIFGALRCSDMTAVKLGLISLDCFRS